MEFSELKQAVNDVLPQVVLCQGLSANFMVSDCLKIFMVNVCLSANFVVSVSLSGNPAVSVSVSVSVRDFSSLFDSVPRCHMPAL